MLSPARAPHTRSYAPLPHGEPHEFTSPWPFRGRARRRSARRRPRPDRTRRGPGRTRRTSAAPGRPGQSRPDVAGPRAERRARPGRQPAEGLGEVLQPRRQPEHRLSALADLGLLRPLRDHDQRLELRQLQLVDHRQHAGRDGRLREPGRDPDLPDLPRRHRQPPGQRHPELLQRQRRHAQRHVLERHPPRLRQRVPAQRDEELHRRVRCPLRRRPPPRLHPHGPGRALGRVAHLAVRHRHRRRPAQLHAHRRQRRAARGGLRRRVQHHQAGDPLPGRGRGSGERARHRLPRRLVLLPRGLPAAGRQPAHVHGRRVLRPAPAQAQRRHREQVDHQLDGRRTAPRDPVHRVPVLAQRLRRGGQPQGVHRAGPRHLDDQ